MSLESTMIIVDNSQWTRNGDFHPTRWESQQDTIQLVINSKLQAHSESTVGIMNMARNNPEVLATLTSEFELLMASLFKSTIGGKIHFSTGVSIAQLALKHRMNKQSRQRIIVFVASPLEETEKNLIQLGKKLKKNNVAIDIINMGQHDSDQTAKLQKLVETVNNADNSHFINVQPGISQLSDSLVGTAVLGGGQMNEAGNNNYDGLVVDPNVDPELAMILRISLEEEKERQRQLDEKKSKEGQNQDEKIEEEKLPLIQEEPLAENQQDQQQQEDNQAKNQQQTENQMINEDEEDNDEELYKKAMELSMQPLEQEQQEQQNQQQQQQLQQQEQKKDQNEIEGKLFNDEDFINELLQSVPGVNLGDQEIKDLVEKMKEDGKDQEKDKDKEEKK